MAMTFETVKKVRDAQRSAQARFSAEQMLAEENINSMLQTAAASELVLPKLTEVEQMIFKMRTELIDYIVAHGLVDGLNWDGENRPTVNGKIVITRQMIDDICTALGYQKEKITIVDVWFNGISVLDPADRTAKITITPEDIKTWYESNDDTNAFTDAEKALLASLPDTIQAVSDRVTSLEGRMDMAETDIDNLEKAHEALEKRVTDAETDIDGLRIDVDANTAEIDELQKTKVDDVLINDVSTLDTSTGKVVAKITRQQVKQAYEDNPDTNAFTDEQMTKLASIEEGAQKNAVTDVLIDDDSVLDHERHAEITGEKLKASIEKVAGTGKLDDTVQAFSVTTQDGDTVTVKAKDHVISEYSPITNIVLGDSTKVTTTVKEFVDGEIPHAEVNITQEQLDEAFPDLGKVTGATASEQSFDFPISDKKIQVGIVGGDGITVQKHHDGTDRLEILNTGVTKIVAGDNVSVDNETGEVTISAKNAELAEYQFSFDYFVTVKDAAGKVISLQPQYGSETKTNSCEPLTCAYDSLSVGQKFFLYSDEGACWYVGEVQTKNESEAKVTFQFRKYLRTEEFSEEDKTKYTITNIVQTLTGGTAASGGKWYKKTFPAVDWTFIIGNDTTIPSLLQMQYTIGWAKDESDPTTWNTVQGTINVPWSTDYYSTPMNVDCVLFSNDMSDNVRAARVSATFVPGDTCSQYCGFGDWTASMEGVEYFVYSEDGDPGEVFTDLCQIQVAPYSAELIEREVEVLSIPTTTLEGCKTIDEVNQYTFPRLTVTNDVAINITNGKAALLLWANGSWTQNSTYSFTSVVIPKGTVIDFNNHFSDAGKTGKMSLDGTVGYCTGYAQGITETHIVKLCIMPYFDANYDLTQISRISVSSFEGLQQGFGVPVLYPCQGYQSTTDETKALLISSKLTYVQRRIN